MLNTSSKNLNKHLFKTDFKIVKFNAEDISEISEVHMKAFWGSMNTQMGTGYVRAFFNWFMENEGCIALKADNENRIIGYIVGAPIGYGSIMNRDLLQIGLLGILTHPLIVFNKRIFKTIFIRFKLLFQSTTAETSINKFDLKGKGVSLVGIGVHPEYNGLGIGQTLISTYEIEAKKLGMDYMRLSVYDNNSKALKLYEKSGWKLLTNDGNTLYYYKYISQNS
jgi:ribosomal protein S18 acetylase RimI-like enzyme